MKNRAGTSLRDAAARLACYRYFLVGLFRHNDDGVAGLARLAWGALGAILAWLAWRAGRTWYRNGNSRAWNGNWHFNGRGYDGWSWVNSGLLASGQSEYSQHCCHQGRNFHGGFLL
jgi:hypothetical protein